jgi:leader peptidase (prepilin peptidase)/N-methyltransferase
MSGVALAALVGLIVGSFLNVCIYRLSRKESVVWPGSRCVSCSRSLSWFENIPIASWLTLRGRCRTCMAPIGVMHPAVEVTTAILFSGGAALYGWQPLLLVRLGFSCLLVVLFVVDLRHRILPDAVTLPGIVVGLGVSIVLPPGLRDALLGASLGGGMLWAISESYFRIRGREGVGFGDVKMLAMVGAFLGWQLMLLTLFLASLVGSLVGLGLILARRGGMQSALPFGTFLAAGALTAAVVGDRLVGWYVSLY